MQEQPKISAIIPLYDKQDYVEEAVRSVLKSDFPIHEVIVVDDGSTDDGPRRVMAIDDPRVRLIAQENRGVAAARNRGIEAATGEYIAFLDADDCWTPEYLPAIADLIARFPECGMYATHFYYFRDDGFREVPQLRGIKDLRRPQRIDRFFEIRSRNILFCTCSVVVAAAILRDFGIRFPEGEQLGEDHDVWYQIAERWPIGYLALPLVGYRRAVSGSLTSSHPGELLPHIQRLAKRYRSKAIPEQHRKGVARLLSANRLGLASILLLRGQRKRAVKLIYDVSCLRTPRFWFRLFLAAHMPARLGRHLIPRGYRRYQECVAAESSQPQPTNQKISGGENSDSR